MSRKYTLWPRFAPKWLKWRYDGYQNLTYERRCVSKKNWADITPKLVPLSPKTNIQTVFLPMELWKSKKMLSKTRPQTTLYLLHPHPTLPKVEVREREKLLTWTLRKQSIRLRGTSREIHRVQSTEINAFCADWVRVITGPLREKKTPPAVEFVDKKELLSNYQEIITELA